MTKHTPIVLTIAGSDSGGGAGVQADIKAFSATGAYGASVITAVTAQNTTGVTAVHEVPADVVAAQIDAVLSDLDVDVIKLGMLFSAPIIEATAKRLAAFDGPSVVDPVMVAKSGDALLQDAAVAALIAQILPHASLLTPNLPEAARLLNTTVATTLEEMVQQGLRLVGMGPKSVLVKGGHAVGGNCTDVLVNESGLVATFAAPRIDTRNTHGTGCTYSAAIAANLAKGLNLEDAVTAAHGYLQAAIKAADTLQIGEGHGPVHHFHGQWE
ncbi:bifunctional hydroxymethylpyrimidine kinase/phosphomethylpyrimidine kinase [Sulfitobacter sp. EhC04]|uniref:bifunctional hydroxymethylpyrimidine kinase/phosphomethylpyrimidine kinase n=1 Tax=Sulfitobacter sp. EhC04 TaxID=1849168 RepID=UPI0007F35CC3|nr:bifunctional hydroxymethylpyrimidine kinase/phosphomethylpyrimidine kinase [Sulfitobacter sp. EhC04]OAN67950.1 bifunctional hydroxymethylpyrimidine kinase/phosphomethylpyrimidine kinase [Sulfitobacter sp. EhC04]